MPLQNRVDPFGAIHAVPERGLFTGNRGIIHDPATKTLLKKRWALPAWIICLCDYQGRRREPMGRNRPGGKPSWTELFFLDEPTALAAGHRPCFFCQRARAGEFLARFGKAFGIAAPRAPMIDARLHKERFASARRPLPPLAVQALKTLPDGAMVSLAGAPHALLGGKLLPWRFGGYGPPVAIETAGQDTLALITPPTTVAVLKAGFEPVWHASAGGR